jgi:hypothetical protein
MTEPGTATSGAAYLLLVAATEGGSPPAARTHARRTPRRLTPFSFVHPRMGQVDPKTADPEFVPLLDRLKAYAVRDAIASAGH